MQCLGICINSLLLLLLRPPFTNYCCACCYLYLRPSLQHRHLCEFHGLDVEMVINEHYYELLDVFSDLFVYIFEGLNTRFR